MQSSTSLFNYIWGVPVFVVIEILLVGAVLFYAPRTAILRDDCASIPNAANRPYSMAKTQLAFWMVVIIGLYVWVFFTTGQFVDVLNGTSLALLGISVGTAAISKIVGDASNKTPDDLNGQGTVAIATVPGAAAAVVAPGPATQSARPQQAHTSFFADIVSDGNGMNIHRMQMLLWTLAFGGMFVSETLATRIFPNFDEKMFGLMGISSGTYVWFKQKEK